MKSERFDPILIEREMASRGLLPERVDPSEGQLGQLERLFTDNDLRQILTLAYLHGQTISA
jgi:hypothetical protein